MRTIQMGPEVRGHLVTEWPRQEVLQLASIWSQWPLGSIQRTPARNCRAITEMSGCESNCCDKRRDGWMDIGGVKKKSGGQDWTDLLDR